MFFNFDQAARPWSAEQQLSPMHSRTCRENSPIFNSSAMVAKREYWLIFVRR
jgi:hypothetical protein